MGFSIKKEFPTRFVNGSEIVGHAIDLEISEVKKEKAYSREKRKDEPVLVLYFKDKNRGVLLKREKALEIVAIVGSDDTDDWKGKKVCMYTVKKEAFGKVFDIIHFRESKATLSKELDQISLEQS